MTALRTLGDEKLAGSPTLRRWAEHEFSDRSKRLATVGIAIASLLFFFRHPLANGFTTLYGDSYDALIEVSILNHWYNVFTQGAAWKLTDYFYPYAGTLGYNDTYIIPGAFFTLGRLAGLDPLLATFGSYVAMKAIGFGGMYLLLKRSLNISHWVAVFGSVLFTIAAATLLQLTHGQLLSLALMPWLAHLLIRMLKALSEGPTRTLLASGTAFALLFAISALNAFYFVWFFCFFVLLALPFTLNTLTPAERTAFFASARQRALPVVAIAIVGALAMIPFLATYLPKLAESGGHSWDLVAYLLPRPGTLVNVGAGNLVWGQLVQWQWPGQLHSTEAQVGFAPFTLAAVVASAVWARRHGAQNARLVKALSFALLTAVLLTLRIGDVSLWRAVYEVLPGAASVRAVTRFYLFALVPVTVIIAVGLDHLRASGRYVFLAVAMGVLLLEQVQLTPPLHLDRAEQLRLLRSVPVPPRACEAFFVVAARPTVSETEGIPGISADRHRRIAGLYRHNVDAMFLASYHNRPTINGLSSFNPPDWNFADPWKPDYLRRVRDYARRHDIEPLCGYDHARSPAWFRLQL